MKISQSRGYPVDGFLEAMMGDLDIKGALSSITSEALLEAAILW